MNKINPAIRAASGLLFRAKEGKKNLAKISIKRKAELKA